MSVKLLFITSHYFHQPTLDALSRLDLPCETQVVPYDNFEHIATVYGQYADQFDACFVSGTAGGNFGGFLHICHSHAIILVCVLTDEDGRAWYNINTEAARFRAKEVRHVLF